MSTVLRVKELKSGADQTKNRLAKRLPIISAFGHEQLADPVRIQNGSLAAGGRQSIIRYPTTIEEFSRTGKICIPGFRFCAGLVGACR